MNSQKESTGAETPAKSPDTNKGPSFQERFTAQLEEWRKVGCPVVVGDGLEKRPCGSMPHRTKMLPKDAEGNVWMVVDCQAEHEEVWKFSFPHAELVAEMERQKAASAEAEKTGGISKDPSKASVKITLDLRTQEFTIEPWVPTPGLGLQLAATLMAHFSQQLMMGFKAPHAGLIVPKKGIVDPKTGKQLIS